MDRRAEYRPWIQRVLEDNGIDSGAVPTHGLLERFELFEANQWPP